MEISFVKAATAACILFSLQSIVGAQQGAVSLTTFLTDPLYQPFTQIVVNDAPICLTDRTILDGNFDITQCPELITVLEAVQNSPATDPVITCGQACVDLFNTLGDSCRTTLIEGFRNAKNPIIAKYSTDFFDKCGAFQMQNMSSPPGMALPSPQSAEPPIGDILSSVNEIIPAEEQVEIPETILLEPPTESPIESSPSQASSGSEEYVPVAGSKVKCAINFLLLLGMMVIV